jgi:hypothetical protein
MLSRSRARDRPTSQVKLDSIGFLPRTTGQSAREDPSHFNNSNQTSRHTPSFPRSNSSHNQRTRGELGAYPPTSSHKHLLRDRLQLLQQTLRLKQENNLMHRRPDIALRDIHGKVRLGRLLIRVINARKALDLSIPRLGIDPAPVRLLRILERRGNMHEVKAAILFDELTGRLPAVLKRRDGRGDDDGAGLGELGRDKVPRRARRGPSRRGGERRSGRLAG